MKTFGKIMLALIGLLAVSILGFYLISIRPMQKLIETNKPMFYEKVTNFEDCLVSPSVERCKDLATEEFNKATPLEGLKLFGGKIKSNLGKRASYQANENSFSWRKFAGTKGLTSTVSFVLNVSYEKDPKATEEVVLIQQGGGPFLVQTYKINSKELFR